MTYLVIHIPHLQSWFTCSKGWFYIWAFWRGLTVWSLLLGSVLLDQPGLATSANCQRFNGASCFTTRKKFYPDSFSLPFHTFNMLITFAIHLLISGSIKCLWNKVKCPSHLFKWLVLSNKAKYDKDTNDLSINVRNKDKIPFKVKRIADHLFLNNCLCVFY